MSESDQANKLLMLAYYFPPRGGSGVQRSLKFARYLPRHGIEPVVVTASECEITQTCDPSLLEEIPRVPVYRARSGERLIRFLSRCRLGPLISLSLRPDAHILWRRGVRRLAGELIEKYRCRGIYVSVQPWSAAVIGVELKRKYGLPLVVDFRDPWSFSSSLHWISKWHHRSDCEHEAEVFREADAIICATPGMVARYKELYPGAAGKIHLIYNGFDPADFPGHGEQQTARSTGSKLRIGFAGRLYSVDRANRKAGLGGWLRRLRHRNCETDFSTHSLGYVVPALQRLFKEKPHLRAGFEFHLAGDIPASNRELVERAGLADCIHFHGLLPHREAVRLIAESDVAFLPMMTEENSRRSWNASGKIFEYLFNRTPILAAVPEGDAADLVRQANAGWVVDPRDVEALGATIEELISMRRANNLQPELHEGFVASFDRARQAGQLAEICQRVTGGRRSEN